MRFLLSNSLICFKIIALNKQYSSFLLMHDCRLTFFSFHHTLCRLEHFPNHNVCKSEGACSPAVCDWRLCVFKRKCATILPASGNKPLCLWEVHIGTWAVVHTALQQICGTIFVSAQHSLTGQFQLVEGKLSPCKKTDLSTCSFQIRISKWNSIKLDSTPPPHCYGNFICMCLCS